MKKLSINDFLANNGKHVWYYGLTDELVLCRVAPTPKTTYTVFVDFGGGTTFDLGLITYVGEL